MKNRSLFWKIVSRVFWAAVALAVIGFLVIAEENIRSKWLWDRYKREAEARGERFDQAAFTSPTVPDEQNFYKTPLLKPIFENLEAVYALKARLESFYCGPLRGWRNSRFLDQREAAKRLKSPDVLQGLKSLDSELDEITRASRRPFACLAPEECGPNRFMPLRSFTDLFVLRASARLAQGQSDLALEDVETLLNIAKAADEPPVLMSLLMSTTILNVGLQPVWEGLAMHRWNESQLAALQQMLARTDMLAVGLRDIKGERAYNFSVYQAQMKGPWKLLRNLVYQNLLSFSVFAEEKLFPTLDPAVRVILPGTIPVVNKEDTKSFWMHRL